MGELGQAADLAREAGDMIRAQDLLVQARAEIPHVLDVGVRILHLLEEMTQAQHALRPHEQQALAAKMAELNEHMLAQAVDSDEVFVAGE